MKAKIKKLEEYRLSLTDIKIWNSLVELKRIQFTLGLSNSLKRFELGLITKEEFLEKEEHFQKLFDESFDEDIIIEFED